MCFLAGVPRDDPKAPEIPIDGVLPGWLLQSDTQKDANDFEPFRLMVHSSVSMTVISNGDAPTAYKMHLDGARKGPCGGATDTPATQAGGHPAALRPTFSHREDR